MKNQLIRFRTFIHTTGDNMAFLHAKELLHFLTKPFAYIRLGHFRQNIKKYLLNLVVKSLHFANCRVGRHLGRDFIREGRGVGITVKLSGEDTGYSLDNMDDIMAFMEKVKGLFTKLEEAYGSVNSKLFSDEEPRTERDLVRYAVKAK